MGAGRRTCCRRNRIIRDGPARGGQEGEGAGDQGMQMPSLRSNNSWTDLEKISMPPMADPMRIPAQQPLSSSPPPPPPPARTLPVSIALKSLVPRILTASLFVKVLQLRAVPLEASVRKGALPRHQRALEAVVDAPDHLLADQPVGLDLVPLEASRREQGASGI